MVEAPAALPAKMRRTQRAGGGEQVAVQDARGAEARADGDRPTGPGPDAALTDHLTVGMTFRTGPTPERGVML